MLGGELVEIRGTQIMRHLFHCLIEQREHTTILTNSVRHAPDREFVSNVHSVLLTTFDGSLSAPVEVYAEIEKHQPPGVRFVMTLEVAAGSVT